MSAVQTIIPVIRKHEIRDYLDMFELTFTISSFIHFLERNTQSVEHKDCFAVFSHDQFEVVNDIKIFSKNSPTAKAVITQLIYFGLRNPSHSNRTATIEENDESRGFLPDFHVLKFKKLIYTYMDEIGGNSIYI